MPCRQAPFSMILNWESLQRHQQVTFRTDSPLHAGVYECRVLEASPTTLRVSMPTDKGKLVFVPVGTGVDLEVVMQDEVHSFRALVVERRGGEDRSLLLRRSDDVVEKEQKTCKTIAVTSGKGGVGKTAFVVNLGTALVEAGYTVCVIDADLGTANVDVLLDVTPTYNLSHVLFGQKRILEVLIEGPAGLILLPGGSGLQSLTELSERRYRRLYDEFKLLEQFADIILLDTGSGLGRAVTRFVAAADESIIVTTPEPHAIVDAYALMKVMAQNGLSRRLRLIVNKVYDEDEGQAIADKMTFASEKFLSTKIDYLGCIAEDGAVGRSVRARQPLLLISPSSPAARDIRQIAYHLMNDFTVNRRENRSSKNIRRETLSFVQRLRTLFDR